MKRQISTARGYLNEAERAGALAQMLLLRPLPILRETPSAGDQVAPTRYLVTLWLCGELSPDELSLQSWPCDGWPTFAYAPHRREKENDFEKKKEVGRTGGAESRPTL